MRQALEMALEALEANLGNWRAKTNAITAIKEALAQPEQEPVLWLDDGVIHTSNLPANYTGCLYTYPSQRQSLTDKNNKSETHKGITQ